MELKKVGLVLTYFCRIFISGGTFRVSKDSKKGGWRHLTLLAFGFKSFIKQLHSAVEHDPKRVKWKHRFWDQGTPHLPIEVFCIGPIDSTRNPHEVTGFHLLPKNHLANAQKLQIWDMNLCITYVYVQIRNVMHMNMYTWLYTNIFAMHLCHIRMSSVLF